MTSNVDLDEAAREFAADPRNNVVLEASAGTGKTTVLVQRYVNLLKAGIEPAHILAITFTRKAATEMRERIIRQLRSAASLSEMDRARWMSLRDRLGEISISTIDAFCLSLLREFPLEADLDPGFDLADETEVPRLVEEALDKSLRIFTGLSKEDPDVALVLAQLGVSRTRSGLAALLDRRLVAWGALNRFLARGPRDLHADAVCARASRDLLAALEGIPGGLSAFVADGPARHPRFQLFTRQLERLRTNAAPTDAAVRAMLDRIALHFMTQDGGARKGGSIPPYNASHYPDPEAAKRHRAAIQAIAPQVVTVMRRFSRDLNAVLARGIRRMFSIALEQYRRTLESRSALDFSDVLQRALELLRRMDEFSQSRFRLESRYHHVLVDEFQDTSRAQWELVSLLVQSWGEGMGLATSPSIFIVGDRKQSIYRFRDAEVVVLQEAARYIDGLRPGESARRSIARSFRAVPELLEFVNDVCAAMATPSTAQGSFEYREEDRFPPVTTGAELRGPALGISAADSPEACAAAVAAEIQRLLRDEVVRDKKTGVARAVRPGDIAILFRSRSSHREFERELAGRNIPTYVYKGLGFFDADEIKDATALLRYLARPSSHLRAAALLRSGIARISDATLAALGPRLAEAILGGFPEGVVTDADDRRVLAHLRDELPEWLALVDRLPPADLFEQILPNIAYAYEIRGRRAQQAWENLKKMRGLIRRIQNRGYATLGRIANHIDALSAGDESNAVLEAVDAVNLMTVHASKGLEFPVVFVVNVAKGASGVPRPIKVIADDGAEEPSVSVSPFVSETDEREREREQHESRRLVYVALTRARDRLYLSGVVKNGDMRIGPGALAEVLPPSIKALFLAAAVTSERELVWTGSSGRAFRWRVCRPEAGDQEVAPVGPGSLPMTDLVARLETRSRVRRMSVTEWLEGGSSTSRAPVTGGAPADEALLGVLVHRLFQAASRGLLEGRDLRQATLSMLTDDERASAADVGRLAQDAGRSWQQMASRVDVATLLASCEVLAEVPFSLRRQDGNDTILLRGAIDALAIAPDGSVTVLEWKTGGRRDEHERQLALYLEAARALFPGRRIDGLLVYPEPQIVVH